MIKNYLSKMNGVLVRLNLNNLIKKEIYILALFGEDFSLFKFKNR